jgi:hypothetical protein
MKFRFLLSLFVLSQVMTFAQITISNSSYIYIDSVYVYADLAVNLKAADSHIYLRNNAQFLQGNTGGFNNTGLGSLSVYQTNNVNEYSYNYWCSPVGNNNTSNSSNNAFVPTLFGDPDSSVNDVAYVSAAFTSNHEGSSNPLTISNRWIYTYDSGGGSSFNWNYVGSDGDINPGLGFTMKGVTGSSNSQVYEFRGKPNSGTITNVVIENQPVFIGNPYPSGFDAFLFIHDTDNANAINGTLYFWEQSLSTSSHYQKDYEGGYATYTISNDGLLSSFVPAPFSTFNGDGSINISGLGIGSKTVTRHLSIGQGFMVTGKVGTSGVVKTKNSHRVYSNTLQTPSSFFKNTKTQTGLPSEYKQFRLNIDFDEEYTRQLVHNFNDNATEGFDYGMESKIQKELENDAYWTQNNELYVAQASVFNESLSVPIVFNLSSNTTLGFRLFDVQNFESDQAIYLFDKQTNTYYNLSAENALLNLDTGSYTDRFEIRFQMETLSIDDENIDQPGLVAFFGNDNHEIIISNKNAKKIDKVLLYNIKGAQVLNRNLSTQDELIKIPVSHLPTGIYILKCVTDTGISNFKLLVN